MSEFKKGDTAQLKGIGGPKMLVKHINTKVSYVGSDGYGVSCLWFDSKNRIRSGQFDNTLLEKVDNDDLPF